MDEVLILLWQWQDKESYQSFVILKNCTILKSSLTQKKCELKLTPLLQLFTTSPKKHTKKPLSFKYSLGILLKRDFFSKENIFFHQVQKCIWLTEHPDVNATKYQQYMQRDTNLQSYLSLFYSHQRVKNFIFSLYFLTPTF